MPEPKVPVISSEITISDRVGSWKARWGIGRLSYIVPPGLYAMGAPDRNSEVIVTANYKMTYDLVRKTLVGRSLWILVLETYGINVWCAAGKGTFGTGELVRRVERTGLSGIVDHRRLILPLFGAAGVKGGEVQKRSGFKVAFSTIRIEDLPEYLDSGVVSPRAKELTFTALERLVLTPIEIVTALRKGLPVLAVTMLAAGFYQGSFNLSAMLLAAIAFVAAVFAGAFVSPLLLPWLPTRSFAIKGAFAGIVTAGLFASAAAIGSTLQVVALLLLFAAFSSFLMLNFTGSTPYTSRSGVKFEMKYALPLQLLSVMAGIVLFIIGRVI